MDGPRVAKGALVFGAGLVILTASIVAVFLSMRDVMAIGGSCASGGPYEIANPCPQGTGWLMTGGIFGWFVGSGLTLAGGSRLGANYAAIGALGWPALFLALGWNFWVYGLDPVGPGRDAGLLVCAVVFFAMGGIPLLVAARRLPRLFWPPATAAGPGAPDPAPAGSLRGQAKLAATSFPRVKDFRTRPPRRSGAPKAARPAPATSVTDELERLAALKERGAIDDLEYEKAKDLVLGGAGADPEEATP